VDADPVLLVVEHREMLLEEVVAEDHRVGPSFWQLLDREGTNSMIRVV
jgi:hypothetical protein